MARAILLLLAGAMLLGVACGENTTGGDPTATLESVATESAEATEPPESTDAEDSSGDALRAEAEELCPEVDADFYEACVDVTMSTLSSSLPGVMCVNSTTGQWYWATPGATPLPGLEGRPNQPTQLGETCAEEGHVAVKIINFP